MGKSLYTRNCIICKSPDIVTYSGYVIRKNTFIEAYVYHDVHIVACFCEEHEDYKIKHNYYIEYTDDMGIVDVPKFVERKVKTMKAEECPYNTWLAIYDTVRKDVKCVRLLINNKDYMYFMRNDGTYSMPIECCTADYVLWEEKL